VGIFIRFQSVILLIVLSDGLKLKEIDKLCQKRCHSFAGFTIFWDNIRRKKQLKNLKGLVIGFEVV